MSPATAPLTLGTAWHSAQLFPLNTGSKPSSMELPRESAAARVPQQHGMLEGSVMASSAPLRCPREASAPGMLA
jgi:hypothetical protein